MKKDTHPKYEKTIVECSCGSKFETRSTISHIHVELCSKCHPFYTGTQKLIDTAGRVDKFKERMKKAEEHQKQVKSQKSKVKTKEKDTKKDIKNKKTGE